MIHGSRSYKRLLAAVLSLVMALGTLPVFPFAVTAADNLSSNSNEGAWAPAVALHVYDWGTLDAGQADGTLIGGSKGVTVPAGKLLGILGMDPDHTDGYTIEVVSAEGDAEGNPNATVTHDGDVFYRADKVGADTFFVAATAYGKTYGPVGVSVYTYGVADSVFVLDYNLPVELNGEQHGLRADDVLDLGSQNPHGMTVTVLGTVDSTAAYGDFVWEGDSLKYVMREFMDGTDTIQVEILVHENGVGEPDIYTGVRMIQTVTVAPANVMYYEDNFTGEGAITYVNTGSDASGNIWAVYEGMYQGFEQSPDQSLNYGSDPNYAENKTDLYGDLFLAYLEGDDQTLLDSVGAEIFKTMYGSLFEEGIYTDDDIYPALYGDASNDTIHAMAINTPALAELMSFEFKGTGFEIVGRTTVDAYAVLTVKVVNLDTGKSYALPVITECAGGDLNQVPYAVCKDLEYGNYGVTVYSSNVKGEDRMVYVDGVRVYQPLTVAESKPFYKPDESEASFHEIKNEIKNGTVVYGQVVVSRDVTESAARWQFGSTMIENYKPVENEVGGIYTLTETAGFGEYMTYGPNNEIYLSNTSIMGEDPAEAIFSYIAFYVELDESYTGERSIQIGAHLKSTYDNFGYENTSVELLYGGRAGDFSTDFTGSDNTHAVASGTEQYFTVDDRLVFTNPNGTSKALVIIGTRDMNLNVLALTNIKLNGYKLSVGTADEIHAVQDAYDVNASVLMGQTARIAEALVNNKNH